MAHAQQPSDRTPAVTGLLVGAILTAVILYATVQWTNARFEAHKAEGAAATQAH